MSKHLEAFLKDHTLADIKQEVIGELLEFCTNDVSYFYGNGELIIYVGDDEQADVYVIDTYGDKDILVEY